MLEYGSDAIELYLLTAIGHNDTGDTLSYAYAGWWIARGLQIPAYLLCWVTIPKLDHTSRFLPVC